ncbi:MAG: InlB B-repeat-containing protein [Treponema sp.]|nr:InlB B-repeat-containing protein [Treponema sp.]
MKRKGIVLGITLFLLMFFILLCVACAEPITLSFDANGATSGTAPKSINGNPGSFAAIPDKGNLEKTGYSFGGWNSESTGNGFNVNPGTLFMIDQNIVLYAKWIKIAP